MKSNMTSPDEALVTVIDLFESVFAFYGIFPLAIKELQRDLVMAMAMVLDQEDSHSRRHGTWDWK